MVSGSVWQILVERWNDIWNLVKLPDLAYCKDNLSQVDVQEWNPAQEIGCRDIDMHDMREEIMGQRAMTMHLRRRNVHDSC